MAGVLMEAVLARAAGTRELVLEAQAHLQTWYARYGFVPTGPRYLEDGIPHVPMRRPPVVGTAEVRGAS
jgi:ElaA protein